MSLTCCRKNSYFQRISPVGNVFRRLSAKVGCHAVSRDVSYELSPIQLGCSVKGCAEAAIHAVRKFISSKIDSHDSKDIVIPVLKHAFNSVRRDHVLHTCLDRTLEKAKPAFLDYSKSSSVIVSGHSIT